MMAQAEAEYETQKVSTYLFDMDHRTELTVAFKKDLPTIQYVSVKDYLNKVYKAKDFESLRIIVLSGSGL
jgi:hypothetical protein